MAGIQPESRPPREFCFTVLGGIAFRKLGVSDELYHEVGSAVYMRRLIGNVAETVRALIRRDRRRAA